MGNHLPHPRIAQQHAQMTRELMTQHSASQHKTLPEARCNIQMFRFTLPTFPFMFTFFHQDQHIVSMVLKICLFQWLRVAAHTKTHFQAHKAKLNSMEQLLKLVYCWMFLCLCCRKTIRKTLKDSHSLSNSNFWSFPPRDVR